jgi:hypothetical protein
MRCFGDFCRLVAGCSRVGRCCTIRVPVALLQVWYRLSAMPRSRTFIRLPPAVARWRYPMGVGANIFERLFDSAHYTVRGSHTTVLYLINQYILKTFLCPTYVSVSIFVRSAGTYDLDKTILLYVYIHSSHVQSCSENISYVSYQKPLYYYFPRD